MNYSKSKGWGSLALAALAVPLLMGAKGGCGADDISMGDDTAGASGDHGEGTGGKQNSGGSGGKSAQGGAIARGGREATGGSIARGGAEATGGSIAQGGMGATTGGSIARGGASASCEGYEDTTFVDEVTLHYVNAGTEPIYVGRTQEGQCLDEKPFVLLNATGQALPWSDHTCVTCASLQLGPPTCPTICYTGELVRIDPGGSYDFTWTGTHYEVLDMPKECYGADGFSGQCSKVVQAAPGPYRFVGTAWSALGGCETTGCPCNPNESGACSMVDGFATGTPRQVMAELSYPMSKFIELRFE